MEIVRLLTDVVLRTLVGYLEFCLDLLALRGLDDYVRVDQVSTSLLSYFIVGATIGYFLTKGKILPGLSTVGVSPEERDTLDGVIFGIIIVMVFVYAGASHLVLEAVNGIWNIPIGSARATLNAWLASSAVTIPLAVVSRRLRSMYFGVDDFSVALSLFVLSRVCGIAIFIYSGLALAHIHGVAPLVGLAPGILNIAAEVIWRMTAWIYRLSQRKRRRMLAEAMR